MRPKKLTRLKVRKSLGQPERLENYSKEVADHETIPVRKAAGRPIAHAYDVGGAWDRYKVNTESPADHLLFNFRIPVGNLGHLTILDPYGDEVLPDEVRHPTLTAKYGDETIGIFEKTGRIVRIGFIEHAIGGLSVCFWDFETEMRLPKKWLKKIPQLRSQKRPFCLTHAGHSLYSFITRWGSYSDLQKNLTIEFRFFSTTVSVQGDSYRESSPWKSSDED